MEKEFEIKFNSFLLEVVKMLNNHQIQTNLFKAIEVEDGRRYKKIVVGDSAFCFIDKTSGDVLRAASWKSPAKHARGNIFDNWNGMRWMGVYGPAYLK